jgi:hypothetical protein
MRALVGGVPRALADHRRRESRTYVHYVQALMTRLGLTRPLDAGVRAWLREAGRAHMALDRLHDQLEVMLSKSNRKKEARRLERQIWKTRGQLLGIERRLEELAPGTRKRPLVETLAGGGRA